MQTAQTYTQKAVWTSVVTCAAASSLRLNFRVRRKHMAVIMTTHHPRGGVAGRGFMAYRYFCFFSAGFSICRWKCFSLSSTSGGQKGSTCDVQDKDHKFTWKEHINVSSTLIMAPALSNSPQ